jgi:Ser/Thr protein kinase RdoA (MazF antagonist)
VTALVAAEGTVLEDDDLTPATARAWGHLVASFHRSAAGAALVDQPDLVALTSTRCADELAGLPVTPEVFGTLHGDPEPDNVVWGEGGPVPSAYLAGYRVVRSVTDLELSWLPALARAAAAETLRELTPLLATPPDPGWPGWAHELDRKVRARAREYQVAVARPQDS